MPEFLRLKTPDAARRELLSALEGPIHDYEVIATSNSMDRISAKNVKAPHPLPEFDRSTVDGYAIRASDSYGASESQPAYFRNLGEITMGERPKIDLIPGGCALIHTGGMLPTGADSVVMLENTQVVTADEIEVFRPVAVGENVIKTGEEIAAGQTVLASGSCIRPAEIGGLMALGITSVHVVRKILVGIISSGDEIVPPESNPKPGQVRDVNSYTLSALIAKFGGEARLYGIIGDDLTALHACAVKALSENDVLVFTAGSSASARDKTVEVIELLGKPGVLVHGINSKPGKPTILGVCGGKGVIGLPGNPVSAYVNAYLFVMPVIEKLSGANPRPKPRIVARLSVNLASQAGREDWWPVKLISTKSLEADSGKIGISEISGDSSGEYFNAEPVFGKSNQIFNLAAADGLIRIPADSTGLDSGAWVDVHLI